MITQEHISAARNSDARPVHWFHGSSRGDGCDCSLRQRYLIAAAVGHVHWLGRIFHAETLGARRSRELDLPCARLGIGIGASLAIAALMPKFGVASIPIAVFIVATIVMSLRVVPIANNILSYFLGLIGYFASRQEAALSSFVELGATFALGSFAAWIANAIQSRLIRAA